MNNHEEIHRARSGRVLSSGTSVPVELGCITLLVWRCSPTWKLSEPHCIGILWRLPHMGMMNYFYFYFFLYFWLCWVYGTVSELI